MAELKDSGCVSPACILLVFGVPGSGKTMLTTALLQHCSRELHRVVEGGASRAEGTERSWNVYAVHFDEFYPPDTRDAEGTSGVQFHLKDARQRVFTCLEHFVSLNHLGCSEVVQDRGMDVSPPPQAPPPGWEVFTRSLKEHCSDPESLDVQGRITGSKGKASILVLDDNMPLRSMRHEYYQLARKYSLGFAEVCIQCSLSVAVERNVRRPIPIPHSTIETMERVLELPDPSQHHWESRSIVAVNDHKQKEFILTTVTAVWSLVEDALSHPVQPLPEVDTTLKEHCKLANLNSCVHQADNILRKCVSEILRKPSDDSGVMSAHEKEDKSHLARRANRARKLILEEVRRGHLSGKPLQSALTTLDTLATSGEFKRAVSDVFLTLMRDLT